MFLMKPPVVLEDTVTLDYKMELKLFLTLSLIFCLGRLTAQQAPAIVVVKGLSQKDSMQVSELFFNALEEKLKGDYVRATEVFNRIISIDPANDATMFELAKISLAQGKESDAEHLIRNAVTLRPDNEWYWAFLSDVYKKTNNIQELMLVLDELIRLAPDKEGYYYDKANALLILKNADKAVAVYDEIASRFGLSEDLVSARQRLLLRQGKSQIVVEELKSQIRTEPDEVRNYIYLSEVYTKSGQQDEAIEILNKAKVANPDNSVVRLALADTYRALKQYEQSFVELKVAFADPDLNIDDKVRIILSFFADFGNMRTRAYANELAGIMTRVHPNESKAFAVYGDVLFQEKKYVEAADSYREALKLNDQVYQIWEQLLRIEISQGDFVRTISDGESALAIFPNHALIYLFVGIACVQTKQFEKAIPFLKNAADLERDDQEIRIQIYSALGDSYNALKEYKESDKSYENVLEINPDNSYVLNNYAYYLSLRGENLDKAEKMSKRSVQLNPDNASFEDTYAWVLFKMKKYQDARTWIEKALKNDKTNNAIQIEHYGDILYHLEEKDLALQQWQKAKVLGKGSDKLDIKINEKKYIE